MRYQISREFMEGQVRRGFVSEREYRNYKWKLKRQREIRNQIIRLIFTVCLIMGLAISYNSIVSHAENNIEGIAFKYYTDIEVEYGDSLWSIAGEYADSHYSSKLEYIREVKSINHLSGDSIREGQTLVIPYYSSEYK